MFFCSYGLREVCVKSPRKQFKNVLLGYEGCYYDKLLCVQLIYWPGVEGGMY